MNNAVLAQNGTLDTTFNATDIGFGFGDGGGIIYGTTIQPDGKIIVGGLFYEYNRVANNYLARINADGTADLSFNTGIGANYIVNSIAVQQDEKIIIVGNFSSFNSQVRNRIARLNPDGSLDSSFQQGTGFNSVTSTVYLQPDGKILISGWFSEYNGTLANKLVRLNADGTIDLSFNVGLGPNSEINTIHVLSNGQILVGGYFTMFNGVSVNKLARLNPDGSIDNNFNIGTGFNYTISDFKVQSDGKIILVGQFTTFNGYNTNSITRLNSDGSLDTSFNIGSGANNYIYAVSVQADGKIIIGGNFTSFNNINANSILRLNSNGNIDSNFVIGNGANNSIYSTIILPNGKVIISGDFGIVNGVARGGIARINEDGSNDISFNPQYGANGIINTIKVNSTNQILIGGEFVAYNDKVRMRTALINPNGTLDTLFNPGNGPNSYIYSTLFQPDGKIIITGSFTTYNDTSYNRIIRLNNNGSIDLSFNIGSGADGDINACVIQPDGKIIIGGNFTTFNGLVRNRIARLNSDGTVDINFNPQQGANNTVKTVQIQNDQKIIIGGNFSTYQGVSSNGISRIEPNGSIDLSFNPGSIIGGINSFLNTLSIQQDGKIIVGGHFNTVNGNGISINNLARLNSNGSLDQLFGSGSISCGTNDIVLSSIIQPDGKLIVGGYFTSYNGNASNYLFRLLSNGILDSTFQMGSGPSHFVKSCGIQNNGDLIIAGNFYSYNGTGRNRLLRINNCLSSYNVDNISICDSLTWIDGITYYSNNTTATHIIPNAAGCDSIITLNLTLLQPSYGIDTQTACDSLTWIDGITYYSNNISASHIIPNSAGCDSIITLNLTIIPSQPLVLENSFSLPSDANNCIGQAAITVSGNADFELSIDNGSQIVTTSGYSVLDNLCPGVHDLKITDNCGDSLHAALVIPVDSNYVYNNPYLDSMAVDSLGATLTNCTIYYNSIDTAYIDSIWSVGNVVNVVWNIVDASGSNYDTSSYVLNNGNGVYLLQLSVFCPTKALGDYFTVTEAIYFENGNVYVTGIGEKELNHIAIHPNPTNDYVSITSANDEIKRIVIYDLYGKELQNEVQNSSTYLISLNTKPTGIYLFKITTNKGQVTKRVVKQ